MLLLCGPQGAGKSRFAHALMAGSSVRWSRVNQVQQQACTAAFCGLLARHATIAACTLQDTIARRDRRPAELQTMPLQG